MSNIVPEDEREIALIFEGIAKNIAETPPEALLAECREDGLNVDDLASKTKDTLATAIKHFKQGRLISARKDYDSTVQEMAKKVYLLPQAVEEKRRLLNRFLSQKPEYLTAAARDFRALSDEDIDLMLKQFQELGVLDDLNPQGQ